MLGNPGEGGELYADALFIGSYVGTALCGTWSLAVEEHFYLFLAGTIFLLARRRRPNALAPVLPLALAVVVGCTALRVWTNAQNPRFALLTHHYATHLRMDSLMFGVALSYLYHYHNEQVVGYVTRFRRALLALSLALISPVVFLTLGKSPFLSSYGLTLLYVGFGGLVLLAAASPPGTFPLAKNSWVRAIGRDSYSTYLWHMEVVFHVWPMARDLLPSTTTAKIFADPFLRIVGALLFGRLMTFLVEAPFLRLRERYFPARTADDRALPAPAAAARRRGERAHAARCRMRGSSSISGRLELHFARGRALSEPMRRRAIPTTARSDQTMR